MIIKIDEFIRDYENYYDIAKSIIKESERIKREYDLDRYVELINDFLNKNDIDLMGVSDCMVYCDTLIGCDDLDDFTYTYNGEIIDSSKLNKILKDSIIGFENTQEKAIGFKLMDIISDISKG